MEKNSHLNKNFWKKFPIFGDLYLWKLFLSEKIPLEIISAGENVVGKKFLISPLFWKKIPLEKNNWKNFPLEKVSQIGKSLDKYSVGKKFLWKDVHWKKLPKK